MKPICKQLAALAGAGALASVGLFASVSPAQHRANRQDRFISEIETVLAMTPTQKDAAQTAIQQARQSAMPVERDMMNTNKALQTAIHSGDTAQIQHLSTVEGQDVGQLLAIRSDAVAKVYKTLTPEQKQKADALHEVLTQAFRQRAEQASARAGS